MEEFIQFSAKTKNEAITKACIELGVSSDQLEIEVVSEGSSGFFGIGSKPAIIKARKINTVSEEDEIQEIVDTVKVDAIKEEQNRKPAKPFVKAEKPADRITYVAFSTAVGANDSRNSIMKFEIDFLCKGLKPVHFNIF